MTRSVIGLMVFALLMLFQAGPAFARTHHHASHPVKTYTAHSSRALQMQRQLANLGHYTGPLDGLVGPLTRQALMDFQREKGLYVSGIATKQTLALLNTPKKEMEATPVAAMNRQPFALPIAYFANPWTAKPEWLPKN
ncbi:MAG: peptidoglycan-binding protein [Proteobacteria bacterium]|nr:peptidoglycan-binding protein [Pseudomonadota bacterium]